MIDRAVADAAFALKRARSARRSRAGSAPCSSRSSRSSRRRYASRSKRSRPRSSARSRTERAQASSAPSTTRSRTNARGGATLTEIAKKLGLTARTIEAVDRSGRGRDGKPVAGPAQASMSSRGFQRRVGVENEPLQIGRGKAAMSGTRSRGHALARAHARRGQGPVESAGATIRSPSACKAKADEMLDKLKAGTPLARGRRGQQAQAGIRRRPQARQPADAASRRARSTRCSRPPKDAPGSAEGKRRRERIVFRVTDITVPAFDASLGRRQAHQTTAAPLAHRRYARAICRAAADRTRRHHQRGCAATRSSAAAPRTECFGMQIEPAAERLRGALRARRAAGGLDHAGRRSRNAGLGVPQGRRRHGR